MEYSRIVNLIIKILGLQDQGFISLVNARDGLLVALTIVLLAGISLGIAQSIILFVSRVQPIRFIFSLLVNSILFTIGFLFLVFSVWLNCQTPWGALSISFVTLVKVLGASYTPQLFSFVGALPYLGVPLLSLLSVWRLLAMVVGFNAIADVGITSSFGYVVVGWLVLQLLENTLGKPIARLGRKISNRVAGVEVPRNRREFIETIRNRVEGVVNTVTPIEETAIWEIPAEVNTTPVKVLAQEDSRRDTQILSLVGMGILLIVITIVLSPVQKWFLSWHSNLPELFRLIFNLVWIGVIATVFAGILAPLETLGWWAGWYEDDLELQSTRPRENKLEDDYQGYVLYLDGIGQSGAQYTPDVENFLVHLRERIPGNLKLIQGLMMYSVLNKPLDEDRPLAFFWKIVDRMRLANPQAILGLLLNLRNVLIVAVSADKRYGPVYNLGIAQVLYNGLIAEGYQPESGIPITLIGYSGGGQMSVAVAPYLRESLRAPIEVISLGGVMSANNNLLQLEHLYHLVGDKDSVERIGPIIFPGRWRVFPLSYWNRAKRLGKITIFSLGPVGHQVPGGMMDEGAYLSDGRSYLEQTIEVILKILREEALPQQEEITRVISNYERYQQASWVKPYNYPIRQNFNASLYHPVGDWLGRLILPKWKERSVVKGVWLEIYQAPLEYQYLIGRKVKLRWSENPSVLKWVKTVTRDVHFSAEAEYTGKYGGLIHPVRLNHWRLVDPLESLAGAHPVDDIVVRMKGDYVKVEGDCLYLSRSLQQVTGRYYALVSFLGPVSGGNLWRVKHLTTGALEIVNLPEVIADGNNCYPSTTQGLEKSPLNEQGWYIYGTQNAEGLFVVQSLMPRRLLKLEPQSWITNAKQGYRFIREQSWSQEVAPKGNMASVLISPDGEGVGAWREGDRALVIHVYGGIGGKKREPSAATPIFFGHFAYGMAKVIREPLTGELRFDIDYYQVYTHNTDGLTAGRLHWSRYMGDRQFGWAGVRPVCDLLIRFEPFTGYYELEGRLVSPLDYMILQLNVMTARYRIGDGTGGTYVGPANNCAQDSNRALFASLEYISDLFRDYPELKSVLLANNPEKFDYLKKLEKLKKDLKSVLEPFGRPRADWKNNEYNLGSTLEDKPLLNLWYGLGSWRTMLPRCASDNIVRIFLKYGATVWVLRTNQIGGDDPDIEAIAPVTI